MTAPNDLFGLLSEMYVTMGGTTNPTPTDLLSFLTLLNSQLAVIVAASVVSNTISFASRTLTTTAPIANTDYYIFSNPSTAATYTLPAVPAVNQIVVVKDIAGTAASRNVTIAPNSGLIDGQANVALSSNYASTDLVWNGSAWNVIVPVVSNTVAFTARTLTTTGPIANTDYYIFSNQSTAATYTLPAVPALNQIVVVKDSSGTASTRNVTIAPAAGTIDGSASVVLNNNYASAVFVYTGSTWNIV